MAIVKIYHCCHNYILLVYSIFHSAMFRGWLFKFPGFKFMSNMCAGILPGVVVTVTMWGMREGSIHGHIWISLLSRSAVTDLYNFMYGLYCHISLTCFINFWTACDAGSFTNSDSLTTCALCLPGSYATQKSTICLACTAGRYANQNGTGVSVLVL